MHHVIIESIQTDATELLHSTNCFPSSEVHGIALDLNQQLTHTFNL